MELWIRSQDKMTLANVYNLYAIERDFAKNDSIWWEIYCNDEISLGLYLKDRAEEVLDEIQDTIKLKQSWQLNENSFKVCIQKGGYDEEQVMKIMDKMYVYEMPKE